jgi:hypothetical protein
MQALYNRSVPEQLAGHPRIYGNPDQADLLYNYIRTIAQQIFVPGFFKTLFPNSFGAMKNIVISTFSKKKSRIPTSRHSSVTPEFASEIESASEKLNLSVPLDQLKRLMRTRRSQILAITDFCLLYPGAALLFCEKDDENQLQALFFLKQVLQLGIPDRPSEMGILFAILIRQGDSDPRIRGHSVDVLAMIADLNVEIFARLETGSTHHDLILASLCADAIQRTTSQPTALSPSAVPDFPEIPSEATPEITIQILTANTEALEQGRQPGDPISFIRQILNVLTQLADVPAVLEKGSDCIRLSFVLCQPLPVEIAAQILEFCFGILSGESFYHGRDSFDAVEAVQNLSNALFEQTAPEILLSAVAATVARTTDRNLPLLLNKLKEYTKFSGEVITSRHLEEIADALDAYHPGFSPRPDILQRESPAVLDEMEESIGRLMDAETVFEEMETVIGEGDSTKILEYPLYLRGFLQRAFLLWREREPAGMTENQKGLAKSMLTEHQGMTSEDLLPGGKYSVEVLSAQLSEIKGRHQSGW